jgi:hypothetical protein
MIEVETRRLYNIIVFNFYPAKVSNHAKTGNDITQSSAIVVHPTPHSAFLYARGDMRRPLTVVDFWQATTATFKSSHYPYVPSLSPIRITLVPCYPLLFDQNMEMELFTWILAV